VFLLGDLTRIVKLECNARKIDFNVISTIIHVESSWRPNSARYERKYAWTKDIEKFSKLHGITKDTEMGFQKTSWGLMQVMGGTARDIGYSGWLPDLCDPEIGVHVGCEYFQNVCGQYLDIRDQFAAYNGGSIKRKLDKTYRNQEYVDKALFVFKKITSN
jgi:hypothetical protein